MKLLRHPMILGTSIAILLAAAMPAVAAVGVVAPDSLLKTPEDFHLTKYRFVRTSTEVIGFNLVMTMFGRFLMTEGSEGFRVTGESIKENLKAGMEWDDNTFLANNWRHPWQGGMYFDAARANGYDFYQSSAFSFAGAWLWEYTGEKHHPAYNDWVNTSMGGITFGEVLWRLSNMVVDNTATGSGRMWRELGCLVVSPLREANRLVTGEAFEVHQNPPDRMPASFGGHFKLGARVLGEERLWSASHTKMFLGGDMYYGKRLGTVGGKPFDYFDMHFQVNFQNKPHGVGLFNMNGLLYGWDRGGSETSAHQLNANMHMTYVDNEAFTYGGQSLSASYLYSYGEGGKFNNQLEFYLEGIVLGASKSDYVNLSGREYDFGPGFGARASYTLMAANTVGLQALYRGSWIRSYSGTVADHFDNFLGFSTSVNLREWFNLGIDYYYYYSKRYYRDYPDVTAKNPSLQVSFTWGM